MNRDIDALESAFKVLSESSAFSDAETILSTASCLGWSEGRLIAAIDAIKQAKYIVDLRDEKLS